MVAVLKQKQKTSLGQVSKQLNYGYCWNRDVEISN